MLTRLKIRNFKRLTDVDIELGKSVILIGPNNSGKTTALQALALWDVGMRLWNAKRGGKASPEKRPGVTINRRDLISISVPAANLLWRELHVRNVLKVAGKTKSTGNIRIEVTVEGVTNDREWSCGFEFDYSNEESFVCRPVRLPSYENVQVKNAKFTQVPDEAASVRVAYLPPMSGLAAEEPKWEPGRINMLLGQGQTAQVLRNLCYQIYEEDKDQKHWKALAGCIHQLFGVELHPPQFIAERGEITMDYSENGVTLDLSASGRGLQQTLLLLAHLYASPGTVSLLDEPDAHLEILRQRETYRLVNRLADALGSQIIAASHSEVVLNEAAANGIVIAFVGTPHRLNDNNRGSQVLKALADIGFDQYYSAEEMGWVLYLEDESDLAILQGFAATLGHPAAKHLERPFFHPVTTNVPQRAREHFYGLREAKPDLVGLALFDRLDKPLDENRPLRELMWRRKEIENYFCTEDVLLAYARYDQHDDLFGDAERTRREAAMRESITKVSEALKTFGKPNPFSPDLKATDEFLDPLFREYFAKLKLPLILRKTDYHLLARFVPKEQIDAEVSEKLDAIVAVATKARPRNT